MSWRERGGESVGRRAWIETETETETEMEMEMVSKRELRCKSSGQNSAQRYPWIHSLYKRAVLFAVGWKAKRIGNTQSSMLSSVPCQYI